MFVLEDHIFKTLKTDEVLTIFTHPQIFIPVIAQN
jgi:hypothetical protein